jgi:cholesterol transport system auxiliary component
MRVIYLIGLVFLFSGCSTTTPTVVKYKISPQLSIEKQLDSKCASKDIKIYTAFTDSSLVSRDMSYVKGDSKVYEYSESAWLNNPNRVLSREYIKMLRDLGLYKSVQDSKSRSKADLIVEIDLEEFMQYYSDDIKSSYSLIALTLSVIDFKSSKVISTKKFSSKIDAKTLDAQGGVEALNKALEDVLSQSAKWFIKGCS